MYEAAVAFLGLPVGDWQLLGFREERGKRGGIASPSWLFLRLAWPKSLPVGSDCQCPSPHSIQVAAGRINSRPSLTACNSGKGTWNLSIALCSWRKLESWWFGLV